MRINTPDGFKLDTIFLRGKNSQKGILFAHGMTVAKEDEGIFIRAQQKLNSLGFSTLMFDFRTHGKSSGDSTDDFTISGELIDLETAVQFMKKQGIKWLGLAGASFGGSISALYAGQNPSMIQKLFLANPVLDYNTAFLHPTNVWALKTFDNFSGKLKHFGFIEVASRKFKVGKRLFDEMPKYFPYKELSNYKKPLIIVQGDNDEKVNIPSSRNDRNPLEGI